MAVIYAIQPSKDEQEAIAFSQGFIEMAESTPWKHVMGYLDDLVNEAQQERDGSLSSDPQLAWNLQWRYQQRKAVRLALQNFVDEVIAGRKRILESMTGEETNEYPSGGE